MRVLIDIGHPAHVHLFKNFVWEMEKRGHEILITARKKDVSINLLNAYNINHVPIGEITNSKVGIFGEWLIRDAKIFKLAKKFDPDILIGMLNPCAAHSAKLLGKKAIVFNDSEVVNFTALVTYPFSDAIITPTTFHKKIGKKQISINSYKELAYLWHNHFKPNENIYEYLGVNKYEKFVIIRFVAWKATHDAGKRGILLEDKIRLVSEMEKYAHVFITSETTLPRELEKYKITFPPEKIHDALYFADLLIGDSQTMTTEAGVLGTPAIRCNSFVGENDMGNFIELEQKYGLIFNYNDPDKAIEKAVELIQKQDLKEEWKKKRENLLKDKIDFTAFMVWFIENYPESFREIKESPEIQYQFR